MKAGITLAEYYAGEALRVFEASKANADLMLAQRSAMAGTGNLLAGCLPVRAGGNPG
jgi:hypothetical protein